MKPPRAAKTAFVLGKQSLSQKRIDEIQNEGYSIDYIDIESTATLQEDPAAKTKPDAIHLLVQSLEKSLEWLARARLLDPRCQIESNGKRQSLGSRLPQLLELSFFDTSLVTQYIGASKASNRYLALREAALRVTDIQTLPSELVIDPTNLCNLKCPLCPTGRRAPGLAKGQLSVADFNRIIEKLRETLCLVWLQNWGEPTLHKQLGDFIEIVDRKRILSYLASNLNRLDDRTEDAILNRGLKLLKVEIDGATENSYAAFRKGGKLQAVLANMRRLAERKRSLGLQYPTIAAACLVSRYNENERDELKRLAIENGAEAVDFYRITLDGRNQQLVDEWSPQSEEYPLDVNDPADRYFCADPWKMISVNFKGETQPCCRIYDDRVSYGNLLQSNVSQIWNNEYFASSREVLASGGKSLGTKKTICHLCMGNLNSDQLEQVDGTLAIRLPDEIAEEYS